MRIDSLKTRVILNSKGEETLEVVLTCEGHRASASSPSGTSKGRYEVMDYPPGGVERSRAILEGEVLEILSSGDFYPPEVDALLLELDGTPRLSRIGGNAVLALSMAFHRLYAVIHGVPLYEALSEIYSLKPGIPRVLENFVGGGAHGGLTDIQEFLVYPEDVRSQEDVLLMAEAYRETGELIRERDPRARGLTLESAYVSSLSPEEILALLDDVIFKSPLSLRKGVDVAASDMWDGEYYVWKNERIKRTPKEHGEYLEDLSREYELGYVEDPFHEDAFEDFREFREAVSSLVVGDDLFATNPERLEMGLISGSADGIIIKPNQIGTVSEAVNVAKKAKENDMKVVVSHRSGETEDPFITHLAVALGADFLKCGAAGIRIIKLNELMRIWENF